MEKEIAVASVVDIKTSNTGRLAGLKFAAKDNYSVTGIKSGLGNPEWRKTHNECSETAPIVECLLNEGAHLVAKSLMDELAYSLNGENTHYGTPLNSAAPDQIPGGSSSGSASLVASRKVDFALGTDTAGSVRTPSSYCGLFGIRFSHGLLTTQGIVPLSTSLDAPGVIAKDPLALKEVCDVLLGFKPAESRRPKKLVVLSDAFDLMLNNSQQMLEHRIGEISGMFDEVVEDSLDAELWATLPTIFRDIQAYEAWRDLGHWISSNNPNFGPGVRERFEFAKGAGWAEYVSALHLQADLRLRLQERFGADFCLCIPTMPDVAPRKGQDEATLEEFRAHSLQILALASLSGRPQVTVPVRTGRGPLGLSLLGARGSDSEIVKVASQLVNPY